MSGHPDLAEQGSAGFVRGLGVFDSTMIVAGSMIGSGVFIVSADISRLVGSAGLLLLVWVVTGFLTLMAALSYGELAAMMPRAGGQYVYLREAYSPLWGFLYGWTLFLVVQTGTIAAVAVAFARFLGVLAPSISNTNWIIEPVNLSSSYAVSLSTQQVVSIIIIGVLTYLNTRGLRLGKIIQNVFTSAKTLSLVMLILLGVFVGRNAAAIASNFGDLWVPRGVSAIRPDWSWVPEVSALSGGLGIFIAVCVAQVGSLFSAEAWNNITFTAGEVKNPRRTVPVSLAAGTGLVISLYLLANLTYLLTLPIEGIQNAPDDRVATAALGVIFGDAGAAIMAVAIMVSTFGCNNGLILAGARVYYAMSHDGLFFRATGALNKKHVPATGLVLQGVWASLLVLPRTRLRDATGAFLTDPVTGRELYGNLYSNLLDYVVFSVLIFYALTIAALFVLRHKQPEAERPYRALGYPIVPALYIIAVSLIMMVLIVYRTQTTWPGLVIVLSGIPVYFIWRRFGRRGVASLS
ncbi:Amino acid permease-associated region [uncultured Desulfobacterium sp.]|uniref:Amino acid permease-associated region n=1 Tax=uncultured Desulfobacterium sp. TaxID=201089 RepID=A0A445MVM2_9BACT|nr:Amino acid permease-associated region [uncultured Desulfobacterium sp.]